jgi:hypothetical protein
MRVFSEERVYNSANSVYNTGEAGEQGGESTSGSAPSVAGGTEPSGQTVSGGGVPGGTGSNGTPNTGEESQGDLRGDTNDDGVHLVTAEEHYSAITSAINRDPVNFATVDPHTPEELEGAKCFIGNVPSVGRDGTPKTGYFGSVVRPDGDITGVFSDDGRGAGDKAMLAAIGAGGDRLDAYAVDNVLQEPGVLTKYYQKFDFEPVARVPFNAEYAPPGVKPQDIVFFKHNGDAAATVRKNLGIYPAITMRQLDELPVMEYDEAKEYRDQLIEQSETE